MKFACHKLEEHFASLTEEFLELKGLDWRLPLCAKGESLAAVSPQQIFPRLNCKKFKFYKLASNAVGRFSTSVTSLIGFFSQSNPNL